MGVLETERPRVVREAVEVLEVARTDWDLTPTHASPTVGPPARSRERRVCALNDRALALWPGLDRRALARRRCDAHRVATYVSRRTSLPLESIIALLTAAGEPEPVIG